MPNIYTQFYPKSGESHRRIEECEFLIDELLTGAQELRSNWEGGGGKIPAPNHILLNEEVANKSAIGQRRAPSCQTVHPALLLPTFIIARPVLNDIAVSITPTDMRHSCASTYPGSEPHTRLRHQMHMEEKAHRGDQKLAFRQVVQ